MKRKILLSPLIIAIIVIIFGVTAAGAAIYLGGSGDSNSQGINLQKGLVGWWKMDGNANDSTSYQNDGTVTGATLTTDRKGEAQKAYLLNGTSNLITTAQPFAYSSTSDFSISVWAYLTGAGTMPIIAIEQDSSNYIHLLGLSTNQVGWRIAKTGNTSRREKTTATLFTANIWHNIVLTKIGNDDVKVYVDGVEDTTRTSQANTDPAKNTNVMYLGRIYVGDVASYFNGSIDDVRVYNRALSATEVTALYQEYNPGIQISDLQKGLVGSWKLDGNANDSTSYQNDGTVTGAVLANDRKGQAQKAYGFNGSTDVISAGAPTSLANLSALSVSAWIRPTSFGENSRGRIVDKAGTGWVFFLDNSNITNGLNFVVATTGTQLERRSVNNAIVAGQWQHVIMTWTGTLTEASVKFYVNGVETTYQDATDSTGTRRDDSAASLLIGNNSTADRTFDGQIDDVRIYNRVLSATEVTDHYNEYDPGIQISNLQKGLVGQWKMDGNANDSTSYQNDGTVTGATLTTDRKGQASKAYDFNGTTNYVDAGNVITSLSTFTFSFWIKIDSFTNTAYMTPFDQSEGVYPSSLNNFHVFTGSTSTGFGLQGKWTDGTSVDLRTTLPFSTSVWKLVTITYDGSNVIQYVDAALVNQGAYSSKSIGNNQSLLFGKGYAYPGSLTTAFFDGKIDDVRIYNRALTATEVMQLYESY